MVENCNNEQNEFDRKFVIHLTPLIFDFNADNC